MLKIVNQLIVFIIELIMLGSFAYFGFQKGNTSLVKYALAITIPLLVIALWSYWAAPKSTHRLNMPYLALLRLSFFLLASFALYKCDQTKYAIILAVFSTLTQIISLFTEQNA